MKDLEIGWEGINIFLDGGGIKRIKGHMKNKDAIVKIKSVNSLYGIVIDSVIDELLKNKSSKSEAIQGNDFITLRFSSKDNISLDIFFDFVDSRISFYLFDQNDIKTNKFYEVTDSYINNKAEAEDLCKFLIEVLSNPIKIISIKKKKENIILKKYFEYMSNNSNEKIFKGFIINKIIFPWQKTKTEKKVFESWIKNK